MIFGKSPERVIVLSGTSLTEVEINEAFRGLPDEHPIWKSLCQLIVQFETEFVNSAAANAGTNNALAMARDVGAYESLRDLLSELDRRRTSTD